MREEERGAVHTGGGVREEEKGAVHTGGGGERGRERSGAHWGRVREEEKGEVRDRSIER